MSVLQRMKDLWLDGIRRDVRHALRQLRRSPAFTATCGDHAGAGNWGNCGDFHAGAAGDVAVAAGRAAGVAVRVTAEDLIADAPELIAAAIPARRAASVDPVQALRAE